MPARAPRPANADPAATVASARAAGLRYVSDADPGIRRVRSGRGFRYLAPDRSRIGADDLARIRALAIPPAYDEVWICVDPRGHLQATGRDARRRKQYRYHARWREVRDAGKFSRMAEFGAALPRLRRRLRRDLARPGLPREKVLAVAVGVLQRTLIRIGNEEYAQANGSYGLTTLRERHLRFLRDGRARLRFRGKGGIVRELVLDDARLARVLRRCRQLPGQALFRYVDDAGESQAIDSGMLNDYLREAMGGDFTAKDFRTWGATVQAVALYARQPAARTAGACLRAQAAVLRDVAALLGNTPAVCRASYVHPCVHASWSSGELARTVPAAVATQPRRLEALTLRLLRRAAKAPAPRRRAGTVHR